MNNTYKTIITILFTTSLINAFIAPMNKKTVQQSDEQNNLISQLNMLGLQSADIDVLLEGFGITQDGKIQLIPKDPKFEGFIQLLVKMHIDSYAPKYNRKLWNVTQLKQFLRLLSFSDAVIKPYTFSIQETKKGVVSSLIKRTSLLIESINSKCPYDIIKTIFDLTDYPTLVTRETKNGKENLTALELAVALNQYNVVKLLLTKLRSEDISSPDHSTWIFDCLLHIKDLKSQAKMTELVVSYMDYKDIADYISSCSDNNVFISIFLATNILKGIANTQVKTNSLTTEYHYDAPIVLMLFGNILPGRGAVDSPFLIALQEVLSKLNSKELCQLDANTSTYVNYLTSINVPLVHKKQYEALSKDVINRMDQLTVDIMCANANNNTTWWDFIGGFGNWPVYSELYKLLYNKIAHTSAGLQFLSNNGVAAPTYIDPKAKKTSFVKPASSKQVTATKKTIKKSK